MHTTPILNPARSGARSNNPNAGKRSASSASRRVPRLSDRVRHPVTVTFADPATLRRKARRGESLTVRATVATRAGTLPRTRSARRPWTADRVLALAARAEAVGHARKAERLMALALEMEGN